MYIMELIKRFVNNFTLVNFVHLMVKILKSFLRLPPLMASGIFMLMCGSVPASGELVQPTRTLEGGEIQTGHLSVFSEPPKMDIYLDGKKIGITPVFSHVVSSGRHFLQVGEAEKELYILSGKSQQFSIYKGRLIQIPAKPKQPQKSKVDEKPYIEREKTETGEDRGLPPPHYFPLNPKGPIY